MVDKFFFNTNACYVLFKIIEVKIEETKFIYDFLFSNIYDISIHETGCSSVQKIIEISPIETKNNLIGKITSMTNILVNEKHGSYVLLKVISLKNDDYIEAIMNQILNQNNIKTLFKSKISSNVLEKCMEKSNRNIVSQIYAKIKNKTCLLELILNPQGFYGKSLI